MSEAAIPNEAIAVLGGFLEPLAAQGDFVAAGRIARIEHFLDQRQARAAAGLE